MDKSLGHTFVFNFVVKVRSLGPFLAVIQDLLLDMHSSIISGGVGWIPCLVLGMEAGSTTYKTSTLPGVLSGL